MTGTSAGNTGGGGVFATRADQICNPNLPASERSPLHFFNTACFVVPPAGQFGDAARNTIEGPGIVQLERADGQDVPLWQGSEPPRGRALGNHQPDQHAALYGPLDDRGFVHLRREVAAPEMRTMDVVTRVNF